MTAVIEKVDTTVLREYKQLAGNITVRLTATFVDDEFQKYTVERMATNAVGKVIDSRSEAFERAHLDKAIELFRQHVKEIM